MGTTFTVIVHRDDRVLLAAAAAHIHDLERRWSRFLPDSEISVLNRSPGRPVIVSPDTYQVISAAVDGAMQTGGRFDPTVHDAMHALGYTRSFDDLGAAPTPRSPALATPGVAGIHLDDSLCAVTLPEGVRLDLGGIGKGSAADRVTGQLLADGARGAAVSIGGDLRVRGISPTGDGWAISYEGVEIDIPRLDDGGVCTSTVTRRRWDTHEGPVHHLVDPTTGLPTTSGIESVTVVGATAQQAEVLTKAAINAGDHASSLLTDYPVTAFIRRYAAA